MRQLQSTAVNLWALAVTGSWLQLAWASSSSQKPLGGGKSSPFTEEFNKLASQTLERWHVPGMAVAVVDGDSTWAEVRCSWVFIPRVTESCVRGFPLDLLLCVKSAWETTRKQI